MPGLSSELQRVHVAEGGPRGGTGVRELLKGGLPRKLWTAPLTSIPVTATLEPGARLRPPGPTTDRRHQFLP